MKNKKKGQVALEFLMTYGWAFLIILVVIGAFIYFDVFSAGNIVPESCRFPSGINCVDQYANSTGVYVVMRNGFGNAINIDNNAAARPTLTYYSGSTACEINTTGYADAISWGNNQQLEFSFPYTAAPTGCSLASEERLIGEIAFTYTPAGSSYVREMQGSVSLPVN